MKKSPQGKRTDELRPEYDLREVLAKGVRGKYVERYSAGTKIVILDAEVESQSGS